MKDMHYYEVAPNQIIRSASASFTYASDAPLAIGQLVKIEVGKKLLVGIVIKKTKQPSYSTKTIHSLIETQPLPEPLVRLSLWLSSFYVTHLGTVLQTLLPRGITKTRRPQHLILQESIRDRTKKVFTADQRSAIERLSALTHGTALLHGVTGSGKTAVYIELAKRTIANQKSVLILVPEIALTSQLIDEFSKHFNGIILTHSRQTEAQRHLAWRDALTSTSPRIVIGPRSALFLPLQHVGLIIIDEAHEPSFKQELSPRYSALRAASMLAHYHHAPLILGSATPSIVDYYLARAGSHPIITMPQRARKDATAPHITLVDMTKRAHFTKHRFLSDVLLNTVETTLQQNHQVLLFHNRRGSTSLTLCEQCGWSALCPRCFLPLTLHADKHLLQCHICGLKEKVPTSCPVCSSTNIFHKGIGTKLIESELRLLFPHHTIARFDGDSEIEESVEQKYKALYNGEIAIIIGTQTIAKGLDLPELRTVGVIQADAGLSLPDFGASERTFQLLAQVVGRVGRSHHATNVIVQSYQPTHPAVVDGLAQEYAHFYHYTLTQRQQGGFPPFSHLLKLVCVYKTEASAVKNTQLLAATLRKQLPPTVQIFGPAPAFYERQHNTYRWQLILKSPKRAELIRALEYLPPTHWQFELDPTSLL